MSAVPVFIGQCGNQIGNAVYEVFEGNKEPINNLWKTHTGKRRAILIDSEPKVVKNITTRKKRSLFQESNIVLSRQGCGTNWALGYFGHSQEKVYKLLEESLEAVRKEVERCDAFSGFIVMHSLAGGTGSGLGSRMMEALRDDYGLAYLLSCAVSPFSTGDSPLQHYNTILTTAWLQRYSDGIIFLQNDAILHSLTNRVVTSQTTDISPSMQDLNHRIAQSLAGIFLPIDSLNPVRGILAGQEPWELLRSVCPMPDYKFMSVHHTIRSKSGWESIVKGLLQSVKKFSTAGERFSSISNLVIARGDARGTFPAAISAIEKAVVSACHCVPWNPYPVDYWQGQNHFQLKPSEASITLCSNGTSIVEPLQSSLAKAQMMYKAGGYMHWYRRYGCTEELMEASFETIQLVVENYKSAVT